MRDNSCSSLENFLHTVGFLCFFLVPAILLPIGIIHGYGSELYYLFTVGYVLFFFPFGLALLVWALKLLPFVGAPLADIVVTILRIATHDLCMILDHAASLHAASLPGAQEKPHFLYITRYLCQKFHFQRNDEVVAEEALPSWFPFIRNNGVVVAEEAEVYAPLDGSGSTKDGIYLNPINQI